MAVLLCLTVPICLGLNGSPFCEDRTVRVWCYTTPCFNQPSNSTLKQQQVVGVKVCHRGQLSSDLYQHLHLFMCYSF